MFQFWMTLNAYLNTFRSVKCSNRAMSWNACDFSMTLFPVLRVLWRNNIASVVENTFQKPPEMPILRLHFKISLSALALKNLCLWCEFQSRLLIIISLLLENFLTALPACLILGRRGLCPQGSLPSHLQSLQSITQYFCRHSFHLWTSYK